MPSMTLSRDDVIVGVDTHKDQHVAVLLDGLGGRLADLVIPATATGYAKLLAFCLEILQSPGRLVAFGVEGTGSYGRGLAGFLSVGLRVAARVATLGRATRSMPSMRPARSPPAS